VAIRREKRNQILASEPTDAVTAAGRWLNGLHVRRPRCGAAAGREMTPI
jgi:hypothetical protein